MASSKRPLSPHLQVYKWTLHMALSIFHRLTGLALGVGTLFLAWWIVALMTGPGAYETFQKFALHPFGQLVLFAFTLALVFHALNGIRHLFWDTGRGFEKNQFKRSGQAVVLLTVLLTLLLWVFAYMQRGII